MTFQITKHNLEYVLDAYSGNKQPKILVVPYDREGNEVEITAPLREEIEVKLKWFDTQKLLQRTLPKGYRWWHDIPPDTIIIEDTKNLCFRREEYVPGLYIVHRGEEHTLNTMTDPHTGFKRVTSYSPKDNPYWFTS